MTLHDLRTENQTQPLGLGEFKPRFSWKVKDAEPNYLQRSRRIQVSASPDFARRVWDSGTVLDPESHLVPYLGRPLEPGTRYWFRVRVSGKRGRHTPWSEPDWFETALAPGAWPAPFLLVPGEAEAGRAAALRRIFNLPFVPVAARLYAVTPGYYELSANGQKVTDTVLNTGAPGGGPLVYQTFDVTPWLRQGENTVEALVANPAGPKLVFSAHLEIRGAEGQSLTVNTDEAWLSASAPLIFPKLHPGEAYDARREGRGRWTAGTIVKSPDAPPAAQTSARVIRRRSLTATRVATPAGDVLDFGEVVTGWVRLTATVKAGEKVAVAQGAALDAKGNLSSKQVTGHFEYRAKVDGLQTFEPKFSFHPFRFVKAEAWPGEVDPWAFEALELSSQTEPGRQFECSDPRLNALHRAHESVRLANPFCPDAGATPPETPWNRWRITGDLRVLRAAWPAVTDWVLADVGAPEADQDDFEALAWRAHRLGLVARSARVLGREREATVYKRMHRTHVRRLWDEFLTPRGRLAVDTQTAHALALAFHLLPADFCQRNFERLAALVEANREPFDPSVLDTAALCQVLAAGGRLDLAYHLLLKESDTTAASVSRGAGEWMYQAVGGVELDPEVSGFQKLVFHPQPGGGITWARSSLMTPHGTAAAAWTVNDAGWSIELEVPPNTTAMLVHPEGCTTYGSGKWTRDFAGPAQPEAEAEPEPPLEPSQLSPTPSL